MKNLFEIQKVILEQFDLGCFYDRALFKKINLDNSITGILGSRGIGKTTYLLHKVAEFNKREANSALYVSADNPHFLSNSILDLAEFLYKETDVTLLCIDEIHKYPNWEQELKNIADIYKSVKVLFTGSSMIDIIHSQYDLSRRVTLHYLGGLSFREYLEFYHDQTIEPVNFSTLLESHESIANQLSSQKLLKYFREYLTSGYYLYFRNLNEDRDKFQTIENIIQKTIYEDIAVLHKLKTPTLHSIEQAYKFILNSAPGELNANKLSGLLNKSFDQVVSCLQWLEQAGLIHGLYSNKRGNAFIKNPKKLLPENTNLMYAAYLPQTQEQMIGKVRESFFVNQLRNANEKVFYSEKGDFQVNEVTFEIGGKNKTASELKGCTRAYVASDGILLGHGQIIPLYLFGLLY